MIKSQNGVGILLVWEDLGRRFDESFRTCAFDIIIIIIMYSGDQLSRRVPLFRSGSIQSAQQAKTTVDDLFRVPQRANTAVDDLFRVPQRVKTAMDDLFRVLSELKQLRTNFSECLRELTQLWTNFSECPRELKQP